jgi:heptaprenyl diphosphate synthase
MTTLGIPGMEPALDAELTIAMAEVEALLHSHIRGKYPLVEEASRHLVAAGGKRLRPLLTLLASHYGDKNPSSTWSRERQ